MTARAPASIGQPLRFVWAGGGVSLQPLGAMIMDLTLILEDGRSHSPLARAPWVDGAHGETGLMAGLSGEWPCLPFGAAGETLAPGWSGAADHWEDPFPHGTSAHLHWTLGRDDQGLTAKLYLPAPHPIAGLTRRIRPCAQGVAITLMVEPRQDCALPIGLHPVFRLPQETGQMHVDIPGARGVWTHPATPPPDPTPIAPNQRAASLQDLPGVDGSRQDLSRLPLDGCSETRLLVPSVKGLVRLTDHAAGVETQLSYDPQTFPATMLWVSNRGRDHAPWSGRHLALGVEPVRAAFDLGTAVSTAPNPLSRAGVPTALPLRAGQVFTTEYRITAQAL